MKKQERHFLEKPRKAMRMFWDIIESDHNTDDVRALIDIDPDFYDSYLYVANDLRELGEEEEARKLENEAFLRAKKRVEDKDGNWPDELPWGWIENRHIIRALMRGADNLWEEGKTDEALDIYRKLLRSNLNDNIGARYAIVALLNGLSYKEYQSELWYDDVVPAEHVERWFKDNLKKCGKKCEEELAEWRKYCIEELGLKEGKMEF